jgi:hypothetical protein
MTLAVDNPIINSPFEEPTRYWDYKQRIIGLLTQAIEPDTEAGELPIQPVIAFGNFS